MKLKWRKLPVTKVWAALLGKVFVGGIHEQQTGIANANTVIFADCFLPQVKLHIREFSTLEEAKKDFEKSIEEWVAKAGLQ